MSLLLVDCYNSCVPRGLTGSQDGASRRPWDLSFNRWGVIACCLAEDLGILASLFDFLFGHVLSRAHILTLHDVVGPKDMASAEFQACWIHTLEPLKTEWNEPLPQVLPARYSVIMMHADWYRNSNIPRTGLSSPPKHYNSCMSRFYTSMGEVADMLAVKSP